MYSNQGPGESGTSWPPSGLFTLWGHVLYLCHKVNNTGLIWYRKQLREDQEELKIKELNHTRYKDIVELR